MLCGLLTKDTSWENVLEKLFTTNLDSANIRLYEFDYNNLDLVPMSKDKHFTMYATILESNDDVSFDVLMYKNDNEYDFVSTYLIDFNGNDVAYYNKEIKGLIVKDSIPQIPQLVLGDNIISIDSITYNRSEDVLNLIKNKKKDTLNFKIIRNNKEITLNLTQKDIVRKPSSGYWTDLQDVFSYNLQPPLYNPKLFKPLHINKNQTNKEDEFSSPNLEIIKFKNLIESRLIDTNKISFEFFKGDKINYSNFNTNTEDYFYLLSKVGTPVFTAFDPSPYDPLNERDTLKTGSLTEVKTSGNWK